MTYLYINISSQCKDNNYNYYYHRKMFNSFDLTASRIYDYIELFIWLRTEMRKN